MKHLSLLSCPTDGRIRAAAPPQAPQNQHLLPPSESWLASAVGSPALRDAGAAVQTGEVLPTLLRWERPSGKSQRQPLSNQGLGKGDLSSGSVALGW